MSESPEEFRRSYRVKPLVDGLTLNVLYAVVIPLAIVPSAALTVIPGYSPITTLWVGIPVFLILCGALAFAILKVNESQTIHSIDLTANALEYGKKKVPYECIKAIHHQHKTGQDKHHQNYEHHVITIQTQDQKRVSLEMAERSTVQQLLMDLEKNFGFTKSDKVVLKSKSATPIFSKTSFHVEQVSLIRE